MQRNEEYETDSMWSSTSKILYFILTVQPFAETVCQLLPDFPPHFWNLCCKSWKSPLPWALSKEKKIMETWRVHSIMWRQFFLCPHILICLDLSIQF